MGRRPAGEAVRSERIAFRITPEGAAVIEAAARFAGQTLPDYIRETLSRRAIQEISIDHDGKINPRPKHAKIEQAAREAHEARLAGVGTQTAPHQFTPQSGNALRCGACGQQKAVHT